MKAKSPDLLWTVPNCIFGITRLVSVQSLINFLLTLQKVDRTLFFIVQKILACLDLTLKYLSCRSASKINSQLLLTQDRDHNKPLKILLLLVFIYHYKLINPQHLKFATICLQNGAKFFIKVLHLTSYAFNIVSLVPYFEIANYCR